MNHVNLLEKVTVLEHGKGNTSKFLLATTIFVGGSMLVFEGCTTYKLETRRGGIMIAGWRFSLMVDDGWLIDDRRIKRWIE